MRFTYVSWLHWYVFWGQVSCICVWRWDWHWDVLVHLCIERKVEYWSRWWSCKFWAIYKWVCSSQCAGCQPWNNNKKGLGDQETTDVTNPIAHHSFCHCDSSLLGIHWAEVFMLDLLSANGFCPQLVQKSSKFLMMRLLVLNLLHPCIPYSWHLRL